MKCFRFLKCCAYVVCALVGLAPVQAQDVRATILGRVTDPTGAAVPGANVEVLNLANSVRTARTTNNAGNYEIPFLDPGQYSLTIELTGFKKYQREGISLRVNDKITLEVANPFYPLLPGTGLSGATVARSQLLLPYPQFTGVTMDPPIGFTWYHSLQARVERRFGDGFTIQGNYTWSKMMQATEFLNAFETAPTHVIAANDRSQLFSMTGIYEFPFGPKRRFLPGARGVAKHVIGGWQAQAIYQAQSGAPIGFGNVVFNGKLSDLVLAASDRVPGRWFNTNAGFDRSSANQLASNIRAFPPRLTGLRAAGMELWNVSVSKNFQIREGILLQLRSECLNATNHTFLAAPNTTPTSTLFGTVTANTGYPRQIYFVGKLYF